MIKILSGPVRSGKTTALANWLITEKNVCGILTPDNPAGLKVLQNAATGYTLPLEVSESYPDEVTSVGRFKFAAKTFRIAHEIIETMRRKMPRLAVIDEVGKLELQGEGFEPALGDLIKKYQQSDPYCLVLVVRDSLLETVISHYELKHASMLLL